MAKYVLVSDPTLTSPYRNFPLLDFLPCAPAHLVPKQVYKFLKGPLGPTYPNGELKHAPYSVRKIEAALLTKNKREDVAVPRDDYLQNFIKDDTEVIAISTMDPLGIGPVTMSYYALFGGALDPWVRLEWDQLLTKINKLREGKKAKLLVGGPGVWEFTVLREEVDKYKIDYLFQGESDDIVTELFEQVSLDTIDTNMFYKGHFSYDERMKRYYKNDDKFISKGLTQRTFPKLEEIPTIVKPAVKGMVEIMRGCGIGCDFCEVTLRPLRYYELDNVLKEIKVNVEGGFSNVWMHSDEFFGFKHGQQFVPNEEALTGLVSNIMSIRGITRTNPTHGRISIPAGYPELMKKLSEIMRAGPNNWIGVQTGVETGSERLAKIHMPNKTLPLRIGPDGSWQEIVWEGVNVETKYFWRPAFTVQVGQASETPEDNWETVALINRLSNSYVDGRPFEFTITPLLNVPLGMIRARHIDESGMLTQDQLAVYFAAYRHLAKMATRNANKDASGNALVKMGMSNMISWGGKLLLRIIESRAKKSGLNIEKLKKWGTGNEKITSETILAKNL